MRVLVIGSDGSMGKRYQAILKHLNHEVVCADKEHSSLDLVKRAIKCDRVIVATPTETHREILEAVLLAGKPTLCEKPISKSMLDVQEIVIFAKNYNPMLALVMQYKYLVRGKQVDIHSDAFYKYLRDTEPNLYSSYNYFRHGNDGLKWDCFQIIALAEGPVALAEDSPVWECVINGISLSLADMDNAYVQMVREWVERPYSDVDKLYELHEKVNNYKCT